jgi:hypothetical protein
MLVQLDRESVQVGHNRIRVLVGKFDLRHFLPFAQFLRMKSEVDITHRRGILEITNRFNRVPTPAISLPR